MHPLFNPHIKFCNVALMLCWVLSLAPKANAAEMDVVVSEQDRKSKVAPMCAQLLDPQTPQTPMSSDGQYRKALCLKFGIGVAPQTAAAVSLLREAALQGHLEAQLALADTLQQGNGAEQREALHWYERGAAAGDSRAVSRAARLSLRLKAQADAVDNAPDPNLTNPEDPENLPPGYHCHRYGMGRQFCHGGMFN